MTRKTENNSMSCRLMISRLIMIIQTQILDSTRITKDSFFFLHTYIELVEC